MLKKLLKYDMRPMIKLWRVFGILVPVLAVVSAISLRYMSSPEAMNGTPVSTILGIFAALLFELSIFAILASSIVSMVFVARRTASNFFSDEGQLTFTLPVDRDSLYLSKFLNSLIWGGVSTASLVLSLLVFMLIVPTPDSGLISTEAFAAVGTFLRDGAREGGFMFIYTVVCVIVILLELNLLSVVLTNYCVIKCRSGAGVGMSIGITAAIGFGSIIALAFSVGGFVRLTEGISDGAFTAISVLMPLVIMILLAVFSFYLFFDARDRLKYDLNVA